MATKPKVFTTIATKKKRRIERRANSHQRGYDKRWKKLRDDYIAAHPLCEYCEKEGRTTPAREVDHIIPFNGPDDPSRLFWGNLQALCRRCHAIKTKAEQGVGGQNHGRIEAGNHTPSHEDFSGVN